MDRGTREILIHLKEARGFDFSGYRDAVLERRIGKRVRETGSGGPAGYLEFLKGDETELNRLLDVLTINVSRFFRDTLTFEFISDRVLPEVITDKIRNRDHRLRIWSAGCSTGEEPYSMAIILHELCEKEEISLDLTIFGTDIDGRALDRAREGLYTFERVKNVKVRLLRKHFTEEGECYRLSGEIRRLVKFVPYDMLDTKTHAPPESIFGDFDMVLCRNLLIYFRPAGQDMIFSKLCRSTAKGRYLVLGEAEAPPERFDGCLMRAGEHCRIYRKL